MCTQTLILVMYVLTIDIYIDVYSLPRSRASEPR
jgi:hypothetical protein